MSPNGREAERIRARREEHKKLAAQLDRLYSEARDARRAKDYEKEVEALRKARDVEWFLKSAGIPRAGS